MKRAMRAIPLTQEHDYIGEFHMATKKQIYKHMKRAMKNEFSYEPIPSEAGISAAKRERFLRRQKCS